jgi:hypothetical protein
MSAIDPPELPHAIGRPFLTFVQGNAATSSRMMARRRSSAVAKPSLARAGAHGTDKWCMRGCLPGTRIRRGTSYCQVGAQAIASAEALNRPSGYRLGQSVDELIPKRESAGETLSSEPR